jgi:hypothetical protein
VGDFTGHGKLDVAVSEIVVAQNQDFDEVDVLPGNGDGTFNAPVRTILPIGADPQDLAAADFTGNGKLGLAVTVRNVPQDGVMVLTNFGTGMLGGFGTSHFMPTGPISEGVAVADFNGDGIPDLVVTNFLAFANGSTVSVLLGNGDGTFQPAVNYQVAGNPFAVVVGDFTGDGNVDIATASSGTNTVSVLLGAGDGTFHAETRYLVGAGPEGIAAADFNNDRALDLATANFASSTVTVLSNRNDGTRPSHVAAPRPPAAVDPLSAVARPDLARPMGVGQQPTAVALDALYADARPELATPAPAGLATADTAVLVDHQDRDWAAAIEAGLANPLADV